jgi:sigma-B regulation protein RsbU (phosphoserine phosphatase)
MYCGMLRSVLDTARRRHPEPAEVLPELTSGIDFFEGSRYASLFYGQLLPDGRLRYFNAGHPPPLWHQSNGSVKELETTGLILTSMLPHDGTEVREIEFNSGDRLLAFTDGIYEVLDPNGREFERDNLAVFLEESREVPVSRALDQLLDRVRVHCAGRPFDDDATVLLIERE